MKTQELQKLKAEELHQRLHDKRKRAQEIRMSLATSKVKNIKELREVKKDIARILTILNTK
ncbi:MAG: 50S ribosomal protein L29 [Candidatus Pacebacteria bacterium]|jgi:large subunit ribosomal protein L29|nr:50S ribosomal protein L29 [Candidatus Paceibacterota bacterium]NMB47452.1 50S ribosomal protein L29 [Patescibacteria group bacterium]MDD2796472.1 50S ribosomal protein L29 [Candidatus Paceibacterota bacterium]MDD3047858.1 50S ribosomal protein L29 [Candidatus Paceibacterota bacterium]MDD3509915.1 50S ribosomal protein L29 [Candidatus Paceibacterota bacterium]